MTYIKLNNTNRTELCERIVKEIAKAKQANFTEFLVSYDLAKISKSLADSMCYHPATVKAAVKRIYLAELNAR